MAVAIDYGSDYSAWHLAYEGTVLIHLSNQPFQMTHNPFGRLAVPKGRN
jgi:hypothetical protein